MGSARNVRNIAISCITIPDLLMILSVRFQIFPRVFATGTDDKPYTTCTVDREQYSDGTEPIDPAYVPDFWDSLRSADQPWEYLMKALASGEIYAEVRGKQIVIVCGHVSRFQDACLS
jgi:hypothetical protein